MGHRVYREIVEPELIVCTDCFADEKGNVVPAMHYGMSSDFPLEMLVTVTFEEHEGKTKFTPASFWHTVGSGPGWGQTRLE